MSLLTAAECRESITALPASDTTDDAVLLKLVASVGAAIAKYLGYPQPSATADATIESTTYTLYSGGYSGVIVDGRTLRFPFAPITSITTIHDDPDQVWSSTYLVASADYAADTMDGVVRLLPSATHGGWSSADRAVKAVVVAGWATASVPTDILLAARLTVRHWWEMRSRGPSTQISAEGVSVSPPAVAIPVQARLLLDPYRLASAWVG